MKRLTSERWLALGAAVATIAAGTAIALWQAHPDGGYWRAPGISAVAVLGVGAAMMLVGFFKRDGRDTSAHQTQQAGDTSVNIQAGRDIRVGRDSGSDGR